MSRLAVKRNKHISAAPQGEGLARRQRQMSLRIAQTSGASRLASRDPVYHLINSYTTAFDAIGRQRAALMNEGEGASVRAEEGSATPEGGIGQLRKKHDSPMYRHSRSALESGNFADRFSSYAFNGGNMAAAVMTGQGKMMLTACLSRALGRPIPSAEKQKTVLGQTAVRSRLAGTQADVMLNRDTHSAVGIVLDTIRGASSALEVFRRLANDSGALTDTPVERREVDTVRRLCPFMATAEDRAQIKACRQQLKALQGDNSPDAAQRRKTLEWALTKQTAVLERKMAEQRRFMTVLNRVCSNVGEAERLFSSDGFAEDIAEELKRSTAGDPPEDDGRNNAAELISVFLSEVLDNDADAAEPDAEKQQEPAEKAERAGKAQPADADGAGGGTGGKRG